jgi:hypothetical protein
MRQLFHRLLDHLVGNCQKARRNDKAELPRSFNVEHQPVLGRRLELKPPFCNPQTILELDIELFQLVRLF